MYVINSFAKACLLAVTLLQTPAETGRASQRTDFVPLVWRWGSSLPQACSAFGCVSLEGGVVTIGGTYWTSAENAQQEKRWMSDVCWLRGNGSWTPLPNFPHDVGQVLAVAVKDKVIAIGGRDADGAFAETRWLTPGQPASGWQRGPDLPAPLFALVGDIRSETIYVLTDPHAVIDGQPSRVPPSSLWAWDTSSEDGSWEQIAQAPDPEIGFRTAAVAGDKLVLFGGAALDNAGELKLRDTVWVFDLLSHQWSAGQRLPAPLRDSSALSFDGRFILLAGGVEEAANPQEATEQSPRIILTNRCLIYDVVADEFASAEPLRLAVADHGLAMRSSEILIIAGEDSPYRTRTDLVQVGHWPESRKSKVGSVGRDE